MSNTKREIDILALARDVASQKKHIMRNNNNHTLEKDLGDFNILNELLGTLTGYYAKTDNMFIDRQSMIKSVNKANSKSLREYYEWVLNNRNIIEPIFDSVKDFLYYNGFIDLGYSDSRKFFSEKEFYEIMREYLSLYGDNAVKSLDNVLNNNRIELGVRDTDGYPSALHQSKLLKKCYITSCHKQYDSKSLLSIAHEFGHAYDFDNLVFPQQKVIPLKHQYSLEFASCFFEFQMAEFMIKNHIDLDMAYSVLYDRLLFLYNQGLVFDEVYNTPNVIGEINGDLTNSDTNEPIYLRDAFIYGLSYFFAYHLCDLYSQDSKEFMDLFNRFIMSRNETSLTDKIEMLGYDVDEFISMETIEPRLLRIRDNVYSKYKIII